MRLRAVALVLTVLVLGLLATPVSAEPQQARKVYRVAVWGPLLSEIRTPSAAMISPKGPLDHTSFLGCLLDVRTPRYDPIGLGLCEGLLKLGYVDRGEQANFRLFSVFEEKALDLEAEFIRSKIDVILAITTPAALAAKKTTKRIPIVFVSVPDPVGSGLVASLARPGGNTTGIADMLTELVEKQLQLLKETAPTISRVAMFWNPTIPANAGLVERVEGAARALGISLQPLEVRAPGDIRSAFSAMGRERAEALLVARDDMLSTYKNWLGDLTIQNRLPAMFWTGDFVDAGALMAYGPDLRALGRRTAYYLDRVLKGADPANLPVEQPRKFELIINRRTAKTLGLTIPPSVLIRTDRVIE